LTESIETRTSSSRLAAPVRRALRESALLLFGLAALILSAALVSYDPHDPGFSFSGEAGTVRNAIGPVGAWVADVLLFLFGRPAFLFPLMLAVLGWVIYRAHAVPELKSRSTLAFRGIGFLLTLAASCGLATLHWDAGSLPNTAGGVLGALVGQSLASAFSFLGATLLMIGLWLAGVALFLGVSWLTVMDRLGHWTLRGIAWLRNRVSTAREVAEGRERKQARAEIMREEQKKPRAPPRIEPVVPTLEPSERVEKEKQVPLFEPPKAAELPPLSLLDDPPPREAGYSDEALEAMSRLVELKLRDFGVEVEVVAVHPGPVVTRFELRPAAGVKVSQISSLAKDLARALSAISVRVVEVIPGKSVVGLEIPNEKRELVTLGEIVKSKAYDELNSPLALALGKDIGGHPVVADLARMPHLLIADGIEPALQGDTRVHAAHHDRSQDAGALGVRGHSAAPVARDHRDEAGIQRLALVRRGDGSALSVDGRARRPQPRGLQPQGQGCGRPGQAHQGPIARGESRQRPRDDAGRRARSQRGAEHRRRDRRAG
jgi:S-DNA-T family DNA segregation ATPase FtsK/SpoIIIE